VIRRLLQRYNADHRLVPAAMSADADVWRCARSISKISISNAFQKRATWRQARRACGADRACKTPLNGAHGALPLMRAAPALLTRSLAPWVGRIGGAIARGIEQRWRRSYRRMVGGRLYRNGGGGMAAAASGGLVSSALLVWHQRQRATPWRWRENNYHKKNIAERSASGKAAATLRVSIM